MLTQSSPQASYNYDEWNRLKSATHTGTGVNYKYNGDGLMVERTESGVTTRYYYDADRNIIAEGTVNGSTVTMKAAYIRGHALIYRQDASGNRAYYLHNGQGDVVELRSASGALLNEYSYDIWGNPETVSETVDNPFRYSGEYWDDATNLQYLRARWYDPSIQRFISEDPYQGDINDPLTLNLYTYVANNPLKYVDPSGYILELSSNATQAEIAEYDRAIAYLQTSETGAALIQLLEDSSEVITIEFISDDRNRYEISTRIIYWNPTLGPILGDGQTVLSASIVLAHEMGHAMQHLEGFLDSGHSRVLVESDALTWYENPIAEQLGESTRRNYDDVSGFYRMSNSTDWGIIKTRSMWPWNWFRKSKYFESQNNWEPK